MKHLTKEYIEEMLKKAEESKIPRKINHWKVVLEEYNHAHPK